MKRTLLLWRCLFVLAVVLPCGCGSAIAAATARPGADSSNTHWIGSWAAASQPPFPGKPELYRNQSLRLIVHASAGGAALRIRISNLYGDTPLTIGGAHVARRTEGAAIDPASDRVVTFAGRRSVDIPPHSIASSDPVDLAVPGLAELAVSLFLPSATVVTTTHVLARQTSYVSPEVGDATGAIDFPVARTIKSWPFLGGVDVAASSRGSTVVVFGDSHVDGDGSTTNANQRWTDHLAARLQERGNEVGVLNEGLIGNRLLRGSPPQSRDLVGEAFGAAGLDRFDRDALSQAGLRLIIVRIGANDIAFPGPFAPADEPVTAQSLISGYRQLIARAHAKSIRIVGTTIAPFEDASIAPDFHTPRKEILRQEVNAWVRDGDAFDGVVDLDSVLRDPGHPARLLPKFDSGDHLHPNDAGYRAMADAVPLALF